MEYYNHDTANSAMYNASFLYNCDLRKQKEWQDEANDASVRNYALSDDNTYRRGFKDPNLEHKLRSDTFDLKYRCVSKEYMRTPSTKLYSDCLGYDCNRNGNDFMYDLDEFNTYHNYPVCKFRGTTKASTCCPENTQIFNNLTRRSMAFPQRPKPNRELLMEETKIPSLTYHNCECYMG